MAFFIHIISLICVGIVMMNADKNAFLWFRGRKKLLSIAEIRRSSIIVWIGLLVLIGSGIVLFYPAREFLLASPIFLLKMAFVFLLFINGIIIWILSPIATQKPYTQITKKERRVLLISSVVSVISWVGATITAFFIFD